MLTTSIGDLAKGFALRRQNVQLRQQLDRLGLEVASGRSADPVRRLGGQVAQLGQIEHDLALAASYREGAQQARIAAAAMQVSIARIATGAEGLANTLVVAGSGAGGRDLSIASQEARAMLESTVSALNADVAGRHLFAGTAVDSPPLADAARILEEVHSALSGTRSPAEIIARVDDFFDAPDGEFARAIYRGSTRDLAPVQLGGGESARIVLRADHADLRATLKHAALAALADDPALQIGEDGRRALLDHARDGLLGARDALAALQADLGRAESRIESADTRLQAETSALELARNALVGIDPYEAATELEAVRLQLEGLYSVTARLSQLSLVNVLS
ncbi:MAG: flagellin [Roseovarius sp.]